MYYISSNKYSVKERQTKLNGKVYDIYFRYCDEEGKVYQKKLSGFKTKKEASRAYTDFVTENCQSMKGARKKLQETAKKAVEERTVKEYAEEYLSLLGNKNKGSTAYDKENTFKLYVYPYLGELKPDELTKAVLYNWQETLWAQKKKTGEYYTSKYLKKNRGHLSGFLNWLQDKYDFPNHLREIKIPKDQTPKKVMEIWTVEEFEKFIKKVDNPIYHTLFVMAFFTGRRKGELLALQSSDVDKNRKEIKWDKSLTRKVKGERWVITSTKANKSIVLPYCKMVEEELRSYTPPEEGFFFGGEEPIAENTLRRYFDKKAEEAGVKKIRFHDLRHSFVSMLISTGANITVVADLISDTVQQVEKTYAHMYVTDREKALKNLPIVT